LEPGDIREDEAALTIAQALAGSDLALAPSSGGRVNIRTTRDGLVEVRPELVVKLNLVPGVSLATRRHFSIAGPSQESDNVATLKVIPYALSQEAVARAVALCQSEPRPLEVRPFPKKRVALLLVGDEAVRPKLEASFLAPTRARIERLGSELATVASSPHSTAQIQEKATRLSADHGLLIIAGQTSIMDLEDPVMVGLRAAGAKDLTSGAPVEPGNLLALAYLPDTPVLCAPGCARSLKRNVVDLVLPRLLLGDHLGAVEIAELGHGGFLTAAERASAPS
jgi:molybdopterin biosynthesis enzyme